jgi:hypothetical protein
MTKKGEAKRLHLLTFNGLIYPGIREIYFSISFI